MFIILLYIFFAEIQLCALFLFLTFKDLQVGDTRGIKHKAAPSTRIPISITSTNIEYCIRISYLINSFRTYLFVLCVFSCDHFDFQRHNINACKGITILKKQPCPSFSLVIVLRAFLLVVYMGAGDEDEKHHTRNAPPLNR